MNILKLVSQQIKSFPKIPWGGNQYDDSFIILKWGENPYAPSPEIVTDIKASLTCLNSYPNRTNELKQLLASYTACDPNQICLTNGSDKAFRLLAEVFIAAGDAAITFTPSYPVFNSAITMMGGKVIKVPLTRKFTLPSLRQISPYITPATKLIYICNPNNPTGNFIASNQQIEKLLQLPIVVVVDEAYFEFTNRTATPLLKQYPNLIILRSFSKTFGLAGLRVGYSITSPEINQYFLRLEESIEIFNISTPSLAGAISALNNIGGITKNIQKITATRKALKTALEKLNLIPYPSFTSFIMFNLRPVNLTAKKFIRNMKRQKIVLKDVSIYTGLSPYDVYMAIPRQDQLPTVATAISQSIERN